MMEVLPTTAIGRITKSYGDGFYAIKPLGKIKGVEMEPIPRVPMCQLGNAEFTQIMPFKEGDVVPISFLSFSQANYLENDDEEDLDSDITNSFVDCIAYPFIIPSASKPIIEDLITIKGDVVQTSNVNLTGNVTQTGNLELTGNSAVSGNSSVSADLTAGTVKETTTGISLGDHAHSGAVAGNDTTGGPV